VPILQGERIRLRAAEREDIPIFLKWINDEEITENLELLYPMSRTEEEQWYDKMLTRPDAEHIMVIEVQQTSKGETNIPIGTCKFFNIDWRNRSSELGIMIGEKAFWNQGFGTETMRLLLRHGFSTLNLHRIWLQVFANNKRAIHVYEKVGFKHEGIFRQAYYKHGSYVDIQLMSVLKNEWGEDLISDMNE